MSARSQLPIGIQTFAKLREEDCYYVDNPPWIAQLAKGDAALQAHFARLFASIPHDWYRNNPIARYEGYFASVCYSHLASLGVEIIAEDVMNEGQCDLTVKHGGTAWVFEFKVVDDTHEASQGTNSALAQLQARDYAAKYRGTPGIEQVIEVGVEFSHKARRIVSWQTKSSTFSSSQSHKV